MSPTSVIASEARQAMTAQFLPWLPIIIGLTVLYVPSLYDLVTGIWSSDEQMHGFADMVLFLSALMLIVGFDTALQKFESFRQNQA